MECITNHRSSWLTLKTRKGSVYVVRVVQCSICKRRWNVRRQLVDKER